MNNKLLSLILLFIIVDNIIAQDLSVKQPAKKIITQNNIAHYDSLTRLPINAGSFKGQQLYITPKAETLHKYGYEGFIINPYDEYQSNNTYKAKDKYSNTTYDALQGKIVTVLDIIAAGKYTKKKYLKLKINKTNDIVYFEYYKIFKMAGEYFIALGYIKKLNNEFINKVYISRTDGLMYDFDTGEQINVKIGDKFSVKKIVMTLPEGASRHMVTFIMKTNNNLNFPIPVACVGIDWGDCYSKFLERCAIDQSYKSIYNISDNIWQLILEKKITPGMTTKECELSWGFPDDISSQIVSSVKTEIWEYEFEKQYLYFKNSILMSIQTL